MVAASRCVWASGDAVDTLNVTASHPLAVPRGSVRESATVNLIADDAFQAALANCAPIGDLE